MSLQSLKEAVLEIADDLFTTADSLTSIEEAKAAFRMTSRLLKTACKAAGDQSSVQNASPPLLLSPEIQHRIEIDKAKKEFRKDRGSGLQLVQMEEEVEGEMVQVFGPDSEGGLYHNVPPSMPIDKGFTQINGKVYRLCLGEDGKKRLVYHEKDKVDLSKVILTGD